MYQAYGYDKYISRKELDGSIKYVVKSGDTLYNIAQKYKNLASLCIERLKYLFYNKYEN